MVAGVFAFGAGSYVGICACALVLRFARGFNVNGRQWPLMVVNVFWLALLAMIVNVFLVDYAPMRVNGFATAPGCRFACLGLGAPLGFQPAIVK